MSDPVNHPVHYTMGKIEVIDFIEDQKLEFHEGNAVKYIARARHKGSEVEDLQKAVWYLQRKIEELGKGEREGFGQGGGPIKIIKGELTNIPNRGPCAVCGKPVHHCYPWWDKNPESHSDARPIHEECFSRFQK